MSHTGFHQEKGPIDATLASGVDQLNAEATTTQQCTDPLLNQLHQLNGTVIRVGTTLDASLSLKPRKCCVYIHRWGSQSIQP